MLTSLELHDFKSFQAAKVPLAPVTVLVGANAAGKSNLLDAIMLLHGLARDLPIADVLRGRSEGGRTVWPGLRGGSSEVVRKGAESAFLVSDWSLGDGDVVHAVQLRGGGHPLVGAEGLFSRDLGPYLFDTSADAMRGRAGLDGTNLRVALKREGKGNSVVQVHSATRSLLNQVSPGRGVSRQALSLRDALVAAMRAVYLLEITPSHMRAYVPAGSEFVGLTGQHMSSVAHAMCADPDTKADLVDWLAELCAPELEDIQFSTTDLGDVMLVLVEKGGRRIPARSLSDGTLRFLGELIALRTAPEGSILLMEEIENGLHPTRAHLLVQAMEAAAEARNVQVIATTHAPLVLNALSPKALRRALLVARPPGSPGTVVRPLGELPGFDEVVERRGVDRMLASGWLERAL
jgi:hypothetical protein